MNIVVIGECCEDVYVYGSCDRLCPEGPVPVFKPSRTEQYSGMAGNTYENIKAMSSDDDNVELICQFKTPHFAMTKTRYVDETSNQLLLRIDEGDETRSLSEQVKERIISRFCGHGKTKADLLIVSDYCKGFLSDQDLIDLSVIAKISLLDTKKTISLRIINAFNFIKMNEYEYEKNRIAFDASGRSSVYGASYSKAIVTRGAKGVSYLGGQYPPPKTHQTFDVSGAGDVFTASFGYNLALGKTVKQSIQTAQGCCSKVIQKRGTCVYEKNMD